MKKVIATILATTMLFSASFLTGCGKKDEEKPKEVNIEQIVKSVQDQVSFPEMADITSEQIELNYQIKADKIEKSKCIVSGGGSTADEVMGIKMKTTADVAAAKTLIDERIKSQKETFVSYNPEEVPKIETAVVVEKGQYLFVAITNDNAKAKKIINDAL
ncbi:MAG: DUF4358 domain-containing protein [Oscillospiraceae bacterium]